MVGSEIFVEIYEDILYFISLTAQIDVLWIVAPLAIATFLVLVYQERYREERPEWGAFFSNSLILLFVSMALFRVIYNLDVPGFHNFADHMVKTGITAFLLLIGLLLVRFNFEHMLPKKIAKYLNSTLTINIFVYLVVLYVSSTIDLGWRALFSLIFMCLILLLILSYIRRPLRSIFKYIEKEKIREQIKDAREMIFQIGELKKELRFWERELKKQKIKEAEKTEKQAKKVKKILRRKK